MTIHVRISKVRPWSRNLWYIRCDKLQMCYDCLDVNTAEAAKKEAEERVMYAMTGIR